MRADVENALTALKGGDIERGVQLLERTVLSFGMKVCGHREDAEDTAQDVLLKLLPHASKFDNPKAFSVWLYTVARNRCLMGRRKSKFAPQQHLSLDELMPTDEELATLNAGGRVSPEAAVLREEVSEQVRVALDRIPPQYRLVLVLHDMEELSTSEVAQVTGLREGTVRVRLHRARLALRKEFARRERDLPARTEKSAAKPRRCREIFAALSDFLDRSLDPEMCQRLEQHLAGCQPCEAFLSDLEQSIQRCRDYGAGCSSQGGSKMRQKVLAEYRRVLSSMPKSVNARS